MKFRIVYDKPGRLRLRAGAFAFEREYEARIHKACVSVPCVVKAVVHYANGGLLIEYVAQNGDYQASRNQVLEFARALDPKALQECAPEIEYQLQSLDDNFKNSLFRKIARRFLMRWIIPFPLRMMITSMFYFRSAMKSR